MRIMADPGGPRCSGESPGDQTALAASTLEHQPYVVHVAANHEQFVNRSLIGLPQPRRGFEEMRTGARAPLEGTRVQIERTPLGEHIAYRPAAQLKDGVPTTDIGDRVVHAAQRFAQSESHRLR